MVDIPLRAVRESDGGEWLRLRLGLWPETSVEDHRRAMDEILSDPERQETIVAVRPDGGLAGFIELRVRPYADGVSTRPVGYIEGWYLDPDVRRQGIGRRLVELGEAWARARQCVHMASDCALSNDGSRSAHLALGYEESERLIHFRKRLDPV